MMARVIVAAAHLRHLPWPWFSFLFNKSNSRLFSSVRPAAPSRGLRPLGPHPSGGEESDPAPKKSRNELKREARRAVRWGMELATFSTPQIKRVLRIVSLDREVFDALMLVKRLGPDVREGKRRQFNYIGRFLRDVPPELMDSLIQASKDGDDGRLLVLSGNETWSTENDDEEEDDTYGEEVVYDTDAPVKETENYTEIAAKWFDGIVENDHSIMKEVYSLHVEFDRQELRKLVRRVHSVQEGLLVDNSGAENDAVLTNAKKPLIDFLRLLAKKTLAEQSGIFPKLD